MDYIVIFCHCNVDGHDKTDRNQPSDENNEYSHMGGNELYSKLSSDDSDTVHSDGDADDRNVSYAMEDYDEEAKQASDKWSFHSHQRLESVIFAFPGMDEHGSDGNNCLSLDRASRKATSS